MAGHQIPYINHIKCQLLSSLSIWLRQKSTEIMDDHGVSAIHLQDAGPPSSASSAQMLALGVGEEGHSDNVVFGVVTLTFWLSGKLG